MRPFTMVGVVLALLQFYCICVMQSGVTAADAGVQMFVNICGYNGVVKETSFF